MSDSGALEVQQELPLDASLEALPVAVATFTAELRLVAANRRFLRLCAAPVAGATLEKLLPAAGQPIGPLRDGEQAEHLARDAQGLTVALSLSRAGDRVGVFARPAVSSADAPLAAALAALADQSRAQDALLSLSREVALASSEEELVAAISRAIRDLFPGRTFCVRIVDPRTFALTSLYADGRLLDGNREVLALRRSAAEKAHLDLASLPPGRVTLTDAQPLIFAGSTRGLATPLAASGQFFGILNLEYGQGAADVARDEKLLIQLANQAAVGVRNAKLIDELTFVKKYLEELIENANALILVVNREGRIIVFNKALAALSRHGREDILGQELTDFVPESEKERVKKVLARSIRGEKVSNFETHLITAGQADVKVSFSTATVMTPSGEVEGVIAIGQDLTRTKELERRVVQAEKLASLGQLAAGVVHEINNPLTTITVYADALIQKHAARPGDAQDLDKLKRMHEAAERILKFARELTSYARPAQDRPELVDVHKLLDQAVGFCDHTLKNAEASLSRGYLEGVPSIRGVKQNLVQVFVNLVTNACHALPAQGGTIAVATRPVASGVEIDVADNGAGIEEKNLSRIFEPFFTTKPEGRGTGLGLSIVQGIVEKHGGSIKVITGKGQGTCFTVYLPTSGERDE